MITKKFSHFGVLPDDVDVATELWTFSFGMTKIDDCRIEI